jgi:glycosyltransferase involved in cell wall biosynthesis
MSKNSSTRNVDAVEVVAPEVPANIEVGLLTGCRDKHYVYGLAMALIDKEVFLDLIGSDEVDSPDFRRTSKLRLFNLLGVQKPGPNLARKVSGVLSYYVRLIRYACVAKPKVFHILWNYKFDLFDRTVLMLYYKLLGKKIAFTAHNVNAGKRDLNDSLFNRLTLRIQYRLVDHIFVHTEQMKAELLQDFGVREKAVTVIPYGINNALPCTDLTATAAKRRLGIRDGERTILFFGNIGPYKGLDSLVASFQSLNDRNGQYRLIIAGKPRGGAEKYVNEIREATSSDVDRGRIIQRIEHIPDQDAELYFKAADVLVLPYTYIFQSGVLFLGYSFGLPVIATDVGSLREDIVEGETGFLCRPSDPADLTRVIEAYFESELFKNLSNRREQIREYADKRHSWNVVGELTRNVYAQLLTRDRP